MMFNDMMPLISTFDSVVSACRRRAVKLCS